MSFSDSDSTPIATPSSSSADISSSSFSLASLISHPNEDTPSLSSASSSIDGLDEDDSSFEDSSLSDAEAEWQESLRQLELLASMVVIPFFGKWIGRKCAYWAWTRFMTWKYPTVDVITTSKRAFNIAGAVGAAATSP